MENDQIEGEWEGGSEIRRLQEAVHNPKVQHAKKGEGSSLTLVPQVSQKLNEP